MKKLLVFQHVPHEDLGALRGLLNSAGIQSSTVSFWRNPDAAPGLDGYGGLVILGGPMGVYDADKYPHLATETKLIQRAIDKRLVVLGICLGSQLIASALGAAVYPSGVREIGWYDVLPTPDAKMDPLFRHLGPTEKVFQWHGDTFDLPKGAIHLASSPLCKHQAFRFGDTVYALQFHVEVDAAMIDSWLNIPDNQREIASLKGKIDTHTIRAETPRHIERLQKLSNQVFGEFVKLF